MLLSCLVSYPIPAIGGIIGCVVVGWLLGKARIQGRAALPALWGAVAGGALPQILTLGIASKQWGLLLAMVVLSAYAGVFRWLSTLTYYEELDRRAHSRRNA